MGGGIVDLTCAECGLDVVNREVVVEIRPRKSHIRIPRAVDLDKLTELCELVWQRPVEPRAAAYFARLMERQIRGFAPYLPNGDRVTLRAVWDAASVYYA